MDQEPEKDEGYVTLVNAEMGPDGQIRETGKHTGCWAWKHYHKAEGTTTYRKLEGDVVFNGVDFGYDDRKIVLHDIGCMLSRDRRLPSWAPPGRAKPPSPT